MTQKTGKFIVFEGLDGAGKSTQIDLLGKYLKGRGRRIFLTAEPTVSSTGGILRDALSGIQRKTSAEMAVLFVLDRIFHNTNPVNGIDKMLKDGYDVICDRYYYSSLAYQGAQTDFDWVLRMNLDCPEIRRPDLCIFLDLDPGLCIERLGARGETREIYEKKETLERVRDIYMRVFAALDDRVEIVDASPGTQRVAEKIVKIADSIFY